MTPTFSKVADDFTNALNKPRRNGLLAPNTQRLYRANLKRIVPVLGAVPLDELNGSHIKSFISELRREELSAASINSIFTTVKLVVDFTTDKNGDRLFVKKFNLEFVGLPVVKSSEQRTPCAAPADIQEAIAGGGNMAVLVVLMAGAGLRISEALSVLSRTNGNFYDAERGVIHIEKGKTPSAKRDVYLPSAASEWLRTHIKEPVAVAKQTVYDALRRLGIPPCHSFRRFYATHARKQGMNEGVLKRLMGHSKGADITSRYDRSTDDAAFIRAEVERVGLGFNF